MLHFARNNFELGVGRSCFAANDFAIRNAQELPALVSKHVLAALARHAEAGSPSRHRFHAGVARQAEIRAVVRLQLHHAAATGNNLQQAIAGWTFRVRLEGSRAIGGEAQELPVARLPANCKTSETLYSTAQRSDSQCKIFVARKIAALVVCRWRCTVELQRIARSRAVGQGAGFRRFGRHGLRRR